MEKTNSYNFDEYKFSTLGEFKMYISSGWHLLFEYNNVEYGIECTSDKNLFDIWIYNKGDIANDLTIEQLLNFEIDGVKIRDFITTDEVEITDRPGSI